MSRDKQIEEIADLEHLLRIRRIDIEKQGCDLYSLLHKTESEEESIANYLIGHGYRKASDVAEEIFADLDKALGELAMKYSDEGLNEYFGVCELVFTKVLYPIRKKYTESEKDK